MQSTKSDDNFNDNIDKLDFDDCKKPVAVLQDGRVNDNGYDGEECGPGGLLRDDESLLGNVVEGMIDRDRRKLRRTIIKYASFVCAILCW